MAMRTETLDYIKRHNLDEWVPLATGCSYGPNDSVDPNHTVPYYPEWEDLVRLHRLILERRVTTILEFGCGYSTIIMAHAMAINAERHQDYVKTNLRRNNPFELHSVDDMPDYIDLTRGRIPDSLTPYVHLHFSPVRMCTFQDRIATEYESLPNICPDFIYLDGPSQHSVSGQINGISSAHPDRLPMACDLLKMEYFLLPGTLILVDGRTANARFLKNNFQQDWAYRHDVKADIHIFELNEPPLGRLNRLQLNYCLGEGEG